jgi:DNA-binding SARP family transcriptional activator
MIKLLGRIDFTEEFPYRCQSLLAYLIVHRHRAYHRDELVDALTFNNRKELRQVLWQLGPMRDQVFMIEGEFIGFNGYPTDVSKFEYEGDLDFYRGPLLPGWQNDWVIWHRVRLDLLFFERAHTQMNDALRGNRHDDVERLARKMLVIDPLYSPALTGICASLEARGLHDVATRYKEGGTIEI